MKKQLSWIMAVTVVVAGSLTTAHGQEASSLVPYSDGVDAKSTSFNKYVSLNDNLSGYMLATKDGLSLIGNDQFKVTTNYPVKDYEIINDVDGKGNKDILVYLASPDGQNNVALISSDDSSVLFEKNFSHLNAKQNGEEFKENSRVLQMMYINDRIYILYDYSIVCLDTAGKELFRYEDKDNIWKMTSISEGNIAFTCQSGAIEMLDGQTGKIKWSTQLTSKVEVPTMEMGRNSQVQLNVWDVYSNNDSLFATTEDGILVELNKETGDIVNNVNLNFTTVEQIIRNLSSNAGYDNNYRPVVDPTGITNKNFMGYKIEPLKDQLLLISSYLGSEKQQPSSKEQNTENLVPKLGIYDTETNELKTTFALDKYNLKTSNAITSTYEDKEVLIVPSYSLKGVLKVNVYSLADGTLLAQENIKAPSIKDKDETIKITKVDNRYLVQSEGNVTFYVSNDFKTVEYIGNLSIASKIADTTTGMLVSYSESGVVNKVKKLNNGNKDDVVYEVNLPEQFIGNSNGFEAIEYDEVNNELFMLINKRNSNNEVEASYITVVNASDGTILVNDSVVLEKGTDDKGKAYTRYITGEKIQNFKDLNNDGHREILVDSFIVDGKTLTLKSGLSMAVEEPGLTIDVGDVNGDDIADFIVFGETQATLYYSKVNGYDISYSKSGIKTAYTKDLQNNVTATRLPDLNKDGIHDVVINARNDAGNQIYQVIDGANLQVKYNLMAEGVYNWNESFEFPGLDFNQDGVDDIIYNSPQSEAMILDGNNGKVLHQHNLYPEYGSHSWQQPTPQESIVPIKIEPNTHKAALIEDVNGDGKRDIAFVSMDLDEKNTEKSYLTLIDSVNFSEIKKIPLIGNVYLDKFDLISVEGQSKVMYFSSNIVQVYDYEKETNLAGFNTTVSYAKAIDEKNIVIANDESNLYKLDDALDFTLSNTKEIIEGGNATFEWSSDKSGKMTITDNNTIITSTADNKANVQLLKGEHDLQFSYDDGHGKTTHQTIHLKVNKSGVLSYLFNGGLLLVLGLAAGLLFYPRYRLNKKAGVKRG